MLILLDIKTHLNNKLNHSSFHKWPDYGLVRSLRWWQLVLAVVLLLAVKLFVIQPLSDWLRTALGLGPSDYSFFRHIEGNPLALVI